MSDNSRKESSHFLVVGSDTGVGKTVFSGLFGKYLVDRGLSLRIIKPFCSGGREDIEFLQAAHGVYLQSKLNYWYADDPISPAAWELRYDEKIDFSNIIEKLKMEMHQDDYDVLMIEGVGGLLAPITSKFTVASLGQELGSNLIIVAPNRVGVINHVLLTVEAALVRGLSVACVLLIGQKGEDATVVDNKELILFHLPYIPGFKGVFEFPWLGEGADNPNLILKNVKKAEVVLKRIFYEAIDPFLINDSNN